MRIAEICTNAMSGSVGKIAKELSDELITSGHECRLYYSRGNECDKPYAVRFGRKSSVYQHVLSARLFDSDGLHSKHDTDRLISCLTKFNPDIVHLHCLHGYYLDYRRLFEYLKNSGKKVVWTMHDCWAYTGHCAFYDFVKCEKWKNRCNHCPQKKEYPKSVLFDHSKRNFKWKKASFTSLTENAMSIVTPSEWLSNEIDKSFLAKYNRQVINNDVNYDIFRINLDSKIEKRVLGVANIWDRRKGLEDFIELRKVIPKEYEILIIGASPEQCEILKNSEICAIERTTNQEELARFYQTSTILFNPTYEDNYPTVNVEALACGLPVVTYHTGGSPEMIRKIGIGKVINTKDYDALINYLPEAYERKVQEGPIMVGQMVNKYIELFQKILSKD